MGTLSQIKGKQMLVNYYNYAYGNRTGSEWMPFYAGVALTLVLLPLVSCMGLNDYQLFAMLMTKTTIGAAIGVAWFNLPAEERPSPIPRDHSQNPTGSTAANFKKAA